MATNDVIARVEGPPYLAVGESLEPDATTFTSIAGAFHLSDSLVVVANRYTPPMIYFFSSAGELLKEIGGEGKGPDEFTAVGWIRKSRGDTLLVLDPRLARLTYITPDGHVARTQQLPSARFGMGGAVRLVGLFSDGSGLASPLFSFPSHAQAAGRSQMTLMRVDLQSGLPRRIAELPGTEYVPGGKAGRALSLVFGKSTTVELVDDRIFVLTGDSLGATEYDSAGNITRVFRTAFDRREVTEADIDAELERTIAALMPPDRKWARQEARELRRSLKAADVFPATGAYSFGAPGPSLVVDDQRRIWVLEYVAPRDTLVSWAVFDESTRYLGRVVSPANFWIAEIRDSSAIGVYRDPDGVNSVRYYRIRWLED